MASRWRSFSDSVRLSHLSCFAHHRHSKNQFFMALYHADSRKKEIHLLRFLMSGILYLLVNVHHNAITASPRHSNRNIHDR